MNTKQKKLYNYVITCIDFYGYDPEKYKTDDKGEIIIDLQNVFNRFCYEQSHQRRTVDNIKQWLLGLALSIDYTYYDISNRLAECGYEKTTNQDYQDTYYWNNIAKMIYKAGQIYQMDFIEILNNHTDFKIFNEALKYDDKEYLVIQGHAVKGISSFRPDGLKGKIRERQVEEMRKIKISNKLFNL